MNTVELIKIAKQFIEEADAVLITAGAGMGVDSGLPDFRGKRGFWRAYPAIKKLGLEFEDIVNSIWFATDPNLAWAFYGHRLNLYRDTVPHDGFKMLLELADKKNNNYFIYTSNVDGHFQKAGFNQEKILEVHGSIHHLQCSGNCQGISDADEINIEIDMESFQALSMPLCKVCGEILRPNILMFRDWQWDASRRREQYMKYERWLLDVKQNKQKVVVIEIGAGTYLPTVRFESIEISKELKAKVIRINPIDYDIHQNRGIGINCGGLQGLKQILC